MNAAVIFTALLASTCFCQAADMDVDPANFDTAVACGGHGVSAHDDAQIGVAGLLAHGNSKGIARVRNSTSTDRWSSRGDNGLNLILEDTAHHEVHD